MGEYFAYPLLGLGNGSVTAALALALVVTYRSSGVLNFATGATALYVAYTYSFLRVGELLVPVPGLPTTVDLGGGIATAPAMGMALVVAAAFGILAYVAVFRPIRGAPPVAKAAASIGLMILLQGLLAQRVGTSPVSTPAIFPAGVVTVAGIRIRVALFWFAATVVVLAVALWGIFRATRFGLASRAVAETEKGARVTGLSPERIALANWALSTVVAGLAGILIAPISPVVPISYTLFIIPALAAAVAARFSSIPVAVVAGFAVGMIQAELDFLAVRWDWLPELLKAELVPLAVIMVVLIAGSSGLPTRGEIIVQTLGRAPRPRSLVAPVVTGSGVGLVAILATHGLARDAVVTSMIFGIIALALVVVTGYAGQISLAQLTLAGVGAFMLSRFGSDWGVPFPLAPLLAAVAATGVGVLFGLPALRIRALSVGVVTLTLAVALEAIWFRSPAYTGGLGGSPVDPPSLFGIDLGPGVGRSFPRVGFGLLCLTVLVLVGTGVAVLRRSRLGVAMLAVRANERSAAASGVHVVATKLAAFAIGAFIAGLGGALLAYKQTLVTADSYSVFVGLVLFAIVYLAGITSVMGGVVAGVLAFGGVVFYLVNENTTSGRWYQTLAGLGLAVTVIANPEGVVRPFHALLGRRIRDAPPGAVGRPAVRALADRSADVGSADGRSILVLEGVTVRYGEVRAVSDVDLDVREGTIVGLIGPNGAGKTTLIDAVSGFIPAEGAVRFGGRVLDNTPPHERARAGLARTFQGIELYDDLTVEENAVVGTWAGRDRDEGNSLDEILDLLHLAPHRRRPVGELSQGQRQLVSISRALVGHPDVVLLDEPAAGLDASESAWLAERIRAIRDSGVTVVLIDHDMDLVLDVCERIVVLELGQVIADATPAEVVDNPMVRAAYLGTDGAESVGDVPGEVVP